LLWKASFVPAVNHEVIHALVNIALVVPHVAKLVKQGELREVVLPVVLERIVVEQVLILVQLGDVVVSEAVWVKPDGGIVVEASFVSSEEPVYECKFEFSSIHVDKVWDVFEVFFHVIFVLVPFELVTLGSFRNVNFSLGGGH